MNSIKQNEAITRVNLHELIQSLEENELLGTGSLENSSISHQNFDRASDGESSNNVTRNSIGFNFEEEGELDLREEKVASEKMRFYFE